MDIMVGFEAVLWHSFGNSRTSLYKYYIGTGFYVDLRLLR